MQLTHSRGARRAAARGRGRRDRGYILAKFALLLVPLLLMSGLSVDVGYWYNRASDIQKAADAAALAGVVWLPDIEKARDYAMDAAERNGFTDGDGGISVTVTPAGERRLRVEIEDSSVGSFFWENLGGSKIDLTRTGLAEYVLPVPMGSPRNYFGTGTLLGTTGSTGELMYQSVNPGCTNKVNGDRHQSLHFDESAVSLGSCSATASEDDYRESGYELYIEAPASRSANIEVLLFDARYNNQHLTSGTGAVTPCNYPATWTGPASSDNNITLTGPAQYQTRTSTSSNTYSSTVTLGVGATFTRARNLIRYKYPTQCTGGRAAVDSFRQSGDENYTFSLYSADATPIDDSDNPLVSGCSKTYSRNTAFQRSNYLGTDRWNVLCTITTSMPSGRYILRVKNGAPGATDADGSNQWGLVAKYTNATGNGLCDGRTDTLCPRVYGKDAISVYANTAEGVAAFYMAEIDPEHDGKTLQLELWDPGEGGSKIEFLKPNGANSWAATNFNWTSYNNDGTVHKTGQNNVASVSVAESVFNGKLLRIQIPLNNYNPPANNRWWKIQYTFNDPKTPVVTDRTTWSAKVIGDPVHLLEEEAT